MTPLRRIFTGSRRWFGVLAAVFFLAALLHVATDSGAMWSSTTEAPHGADTMCTVVCDASMIATPSPDALSEAAPVLLSVSALLALAIVAVRHIARRRPSLIALSISRT